MRALMHSREFAATRSSVLTYFAESDKGAEDARPSFMGDFMPTNDHPRVCFGASSDDDTLGLVKKLILVICLSSLSLIY